MNLNEVNRGIQKNKPARRVGRGPGSGWGKTAARGHKGQQSRAGASTRYTFQGVGTALIQRLPKRGFNNRWALRVAVVNLSDLEAQFAAGEEVTLEAMQVKNVAKGRFDLLKVLGDGELTKAVTVSAHRFSKSAQAKIEAAGGKVIVLAGKTPVSEKQQAKRAARGK